MTIPTFPGKLSTLRRTLEAATVIQRSPFSLSQQVQDWGGRCWSFEAPIAVSRGIEARAIAGFAAAVPPGGRFVLPDPTRREVGDVGAPVVAGGGQSGTQLATAGWSLAPDRRNMLPNSAMQGAAVGLVGAGGALPTGWSTPGIENAEVLSVAPENGQPTIVLRLFGAATDSVRVSFQPGLNATPAAPGQTWAGSAWVGFVAGSMAGLNPSSLRLTQMAGTTVLSNTFGATFTPGARARVSVVATFNNPAATGAGLQLRFTLTSGLVDITLRIQAPQLEQAAAPGDFQQTPQPVLFAGDVFSLGAGLTKRLYMLTEDFTPGLAGTGTLRFMPPLREPPGDAAPLDLVTPGCVCRLARPLPADIAPADLHRFTLSAMEAL